MTVNEVMWEVGIAAFFTYIKKCLDNKGSNSLEIS